MGLTRSAEPDLVMQRRQRLADEVGFDLQRAAFAVQVHGAAVRAFRRVDAPEGGQSVLSTDALTTDLPGHALLTYHADCYPILVLDRARGAVGAAHAGWRGTLSGVGFATVRAFKDAYGSDPGDLEILIGPGICGACYEVGHEVADRFAERFPDAETFLRPRGRDRALLDLAAALRSQIEAAGVPPDRIHSGGWCTREDDRWFSHRGGRPGRFLAAIVAP
jgi:polyphenol oxidase